MKKEREKTLADLILGTPMAIATEQAQKELLEGEEAIIHPWSCGSEFGDWICGNCDDCKHSESCEYQDELWLAYYTDGQVKKKTANKLGLEDTFGCKMKNSQVIINERLIENGQQLLFHCGG